MPYQLIVDLLVKYFHRLKQVLTQKVLIRIVSVWAPVLLLQTVIIQDLDSQGIIYHWLNSTSHEHKTETHRVGDNQVRKKPPIIPTPAQWDEGNGDTNPWGWIVSIGIGAGAIALCFATGLCVVP